mgnify:CR=1 FL=1
MFALIYDEHDLAKPRKYVLSLHDTREMAEIALENRKKELGKKNQDCYTRSTWNSPEEWNGWLNIEHERKKTMGM